MTSALHDTFARPDITHDQLDTLQQALVAYSEKHNKGEEAASTRLQEELRKVYRSHVETAPSKFGPFVTTLKTIRPALVGSDYVKEWFRLITRQFVEQQGSTKRSVADARDFVVEAMLYETDAADAQDKTKTTAQLAHGLLEQYIKRSNASTADQHDESASIKQDKARIQLLNMLIAFGRKQPRVSDGLTTNSRIFTDFRRISSMLSIHTSSSRSPVIMLFNCSLPGCNANNHISTLSHKHLSWTIY